MNPEKEPQRPGFLRRTANEVETVGIEAVPEDQRTMNATKLFIVWAMASASATTPIIGALLFHMGTLYMVIAIVIAFLIGLVPAGLFSEMGREIPLTALIMARRSYGLVGALLFAILFTFVNVGWFGLNTEVGGQILSGIFHTQGSAWFWVVGAIQIILVLFGMKWLEYFYRYTSILLIICYGALVMYLFMHYHITLPKASGTFSWGQNIAIILTFSILSWTYKISTMSRFCIPKNQSTRRTWFFLAGPTGIMLSVLLMGVIGILAQTSSHNWDIALLGAQIPGWGVVAAFGVALAVIHANAMNLYPSTVDLLAALNTVRKPRKWEQPVATVILGVLSTLLSIYGILDKIQGFLYIIGDVLLPFTFIMIVDWVWIQRKRTPVSAFFSKPNTFTQWFSVPAFVGFVVGFVLNFWGQHFLPVFFYNILPLPVVGSLLAALVFWLLALSMRLPAQSLNDPTGSPVANTGGLER